MSKPQPVPIRADPDKNTSVSQEELDIIRERMKTFDQDRKSARPADEVMERLLRRHPAP
jgi:hypothetical protein